MRSEPEIDRAPGRRCRVCRGPAEVLLDLGPQPFCNRFLSRDGQSDDAHPLVQGQCAACGVIQLFDPAPVAALMPRFDWIRYKEEGRHLPMAGGSRRRPAGSGRALPDLRRHLERRRRPGGPGRPRVSAQHGGWTRTKTWACKSGGLESFQAALTPEAAQVIVRRDGPADLVIARYILEHAHDPVAFLHALAELITPTGYAWIEVPDCTPALETRDYTTLWEEHTLYFTPATFHDCLVRNGFSVVYFKLYPYTHENSLVAIVTPNRAAPPPTRVPEREWVRGRDFARALPERRRQWSRYCIDVRRDGGKLAMFGAGHLACMFITVMGLKDEIAFVVDDHPAKRGLRMPGSGLPILPSAVLVDEGVSVCLTSLSPESEEKAIRNQAPFLAPADASPPSFRRASWGCNFNPAGRISADADARHQQ